MCQHNLLCSIVYAHCLLPRRAFASLYVLFFLEKEAEIGGCVNIICFVEKNNIFLRFCLCIIESDTVKSDCPVQIFRKMMKYLKITLLVLLFFWRY